MARRFYLPAGAARIWTASAVLAAFFAVAVAGGIGSPAQAQDDFGAFVFGPTGERGTSSSSTYDREFIKEWEANPPKGFPTLAKGNVDQTKIAVKRYTEIVAAGGWPQMPDVQLQAGASDQTVIVIKSRLFASGDLKDGETSPGPYFDLGLEKAVKRFQASNGLTPTGIVDKRTVAALNIPADVRLKQLKTNLTRLQELSATTSKKYVLVNIPAAQVEAVENGQIVARYTGVVGKPDRPTPILKSSISQLNFNPVWRLPPTVISKDLIPKGRDMQAKGQNVLVKFGIDAYDGSGRKLDPEKINWSSGTPAGLSYSQKPGKENPLGFLKINFDNAHSVYMHDSPSASLFGRNFRAASSGCIRVQNIEQLASWLLADQNGWTAERVARMKETGERVDVNLKRTVPLQFVYITAWATADGVVQFRRDLYQRDGVGAAASAY